ncbi:MAG: Gfo/Idh/MocA family oxidoreductase [Pseudomonadota bacterium]
MRLRFFESAPGQQHIQERDQYLFQTDKPSHRFNVIGSGTIGQEHMRVMHLLGRACVHGIYDVSGHSAQVGESAVAKLSDEPVVRYDSLESCCNDVEVDGLIIATPNHTHLEVLRAALKTDKAVLLEKPMATSVKDAATIVRLSQANDNLLQVGLQYRYKATFSEALREVKYRKSIGEVRSINMMEHRPPFLDKVNQWNKFSKNTGGTLVEKCCHYFDLMNMFAESMPETVYAVGGQAVNFTDFERAGEVSDILDHSAVVVSYENGIQATLTLNMFSPLFTEEMVICGDRGRLTTRERFDFLNDDRSRSSMSLEFPEPLASRDTVLAYPHHIESSGHHGATYFAQTAFVDSLEGRSGDAATAAQGFWSIVVGAAAEESVKSKSVVKIKDVLKRNKCLDLSTLDTGYW